MKIFYFYKNIIPNILNQLRLELERKITTGSNSKSKVLKQNIKMLDILLISVIISLFGYSFYKWTTKYYKYFEDLGVPYVKPTFLLGNIGGFFLKQYTAHEFSDLLYYTHPTKKLYGIFEFRKPAIFVRDPETIKQLTIKDFEYFEDKRVIAKESDDLIGNSLIMLKGTKWHDMRSVLSPAFTGSKMRMMFDLIVDNSTDMVSYMKKQTTPLEFNMKEVFGKLTTDMVANAAFGIKINSFENPQNKFYVMATDFLNFSKPIFIFRTLMMNVLPKIAKLLGIGMFSPEVDDFFKGMVISNMEKREKENIFRPDLINLLMNIRKGESQENTQQTAEDSKETDGFASVQEFSTGKKLTKKWSDNEIISQSFLFFFAGFDPMSNHLSFVAHELAVNPEIQSRLYSEIIETEAKCNGQKITYEKLQKMKYLDAIVSEALRKWPPIALTDRICVKDYLYDDGDDLQIKIKKDMLLVFPIISLHYDEQYWSKSNVFDPERFNEENKKNIIPGTYIPFGIGPRNCIGSRLALMESKSIIYYLVLNFKLVPYEKTQIPLKLAKTMMGMFTEKGIYLKFEPRQQLIN